jgi:asparagine synthase (glutamine-hydrolysing)
MCGITGVFAFTETGRQSLANLQASTDAIVRRGPDSEGHFIYDQCGLGFRRLAILDLSADGNQPMTDASGRYTIVFNGEIFNFRELREKLLRRGCQFRSQTDTEVILHSTSRRAAGSSRS